MDFSSVRDNIRTLSFEVLRTDCDNFFEAVIINQEIEKLNLRLKSLFGEPVFPSQSCLQQKIQETVDSLGGIMPGQTLYYKDMGQGCIFAMLWPWRDGVRTTVKIIQK